MGMGIKAFLGITHENSWGTALFNGSASDYIPIVRATLNRKHEYVSRNQLLGNWAAPNREMATDYGEGDLDFIAQPNVWGQILYSMFGPSSDTTVASHSSGITYQHVWVQNNSRYSPDVHLWPYTLEFFEDVTGVSLQFLGSVVDTLKLTTIAGPRDPFVRGTATFWSKQVNSVAASAAASFESFPPFMAWHASLTLDGGAYALFEEMEFTIANHLERVYRLNTSQYPAALQRNNYQEETLRARITFNDYVAWQRFVNNSAGPLTMLFTNSYTTQISSGYYPQFQVVLPLMEYTTHTADVTGPARLVAELEGYAQYSQTSKTAVQFILQNERASYP